MGSAPSSQRGGKATQSEMTNENTAQVANMTKEHLITSNPVDPKNGNAAPSKNAATLVSCADATNFAATLPKGAISARLSPLGGTLSTGSPNLPPEADSTPQILAPQILAAPEVVTSSNDQDVPNRARALERNILSTVTKQTDTRNSKVGKRPRNRSRRGQGRSNDKDADARAPEETENVPPPSAREEEVSHQRRAHRPGRARQAVKRGRSKNSAGRADTIDSERIAVTQLTDKVVNAVSGDNESTSRSAKSGRTRGTGRRSSAGVRPNSKAPGHHLRSRARVGANVPGSLTISEPVQDVVSATEERPEGAKANYVRTYDEDRRTDTKDQVVPIPTTASTDSTPVALTDKAESPVVPSAIAEADVSTVPPLPSSTRRRTKEYFQRRTRERSADAETGPPHGVTKVAEQGRRRNGEVARVHVEAGARKRPARWRVPGTDKNDDQFAFDPEASPFTPNATSSPRQGSLSSIGVQSFSSPTPLPPHGNRKVAPLTLVRTSDKTNSLEAMGSPSQLPIPVTPHDNQTQGGQQEDTYTYYAGAQVHLQAEQLALMRLQAYYSWLAEKATEHMDMSGGSGGLSGRVALGLGRQGGRGRGKAQSRISSGAYAHPKEHVVYSPREHELAQLRLGSGTDDAFGRPEIMKTKEDEPDKTPLKTPDAVAQRTIQKWDGNWGLREAPGRDIGWRWGANSVGAVGSAGS